MTQEEFENLMNIEGEVRGIAITGETDFILEKEGEEGLEKLEKSINELGYSVAFKEMKAMEFYPLGLEAVVLVAAREIFGYDEEKFEEMGGFEPKVSILIRLFMKHFFSPERIVELAPKIWRESYTVGDLEVASFDMENRKTVLHLKNFKLHPLQCYNLKGYFSSVVKMVMGQETTVEETECPFRGDDYHEFVINW